MTSVVGPGAGASSSAKGRLSGCEVTTGPGGMKGLFSGRELSTITVSLVGSGARSRSETESSLPHGYLTRAKEGLTETRSTSDTIGVYLDLRLCRLTRTGPFSNNQDGRESPVPDRRGNEKRRSCGVALVAVQRRDR